MHENDSIGAGVVAASRGRWIPVVCGPAPPIEPMVAAPMGGSDWVSGPSPLVTAVTTPDTEDARYVRSSEPARYGRYLDWCEYLHARAPTPAEDDAAFAWFMREDAP